LAFDISASGTARWFGLIHDALENPGASGLQHVGYFFKVAEVTVVGVGNVDTVSRGIERAGEPDLFGSAARPTGQIPNVGAIHCNDQIELIEVAGTHLSRAHRHVAAPLFAHLNRSSIGWLTRVPIAGSRTVDFEIDARHFRLPSKNAFGKRASTDVSETDEQDPTHQLRVPPCNFAPAPNVLAKVKHGNKIALAVFVIVPTVCLLGGLLVISLGKSSLSRDLQKEKDAAIAVGMPLEMSDLHVVPVPESLNAARIYKEAGKRLRGDLKAPSDLVSAGFSRKAKKADIDAANHALTSLDPIFAMLKGLKDRPQCDFGHDLTQGAMKTLYPELSDIKSICRIVCFKAGFLEQRGEWKGALDLLRLEHRIGQDVGADRNLIGLLVEMSCRNMADGEYEKLLGRRSHDGPFLSALASQLNDVEKMPEARYFFGGEIVLDRIDLWNAKSIEDLTGERGSPGTLEGAMVSSAVFKATVDTQLIRCWRTGWQMLPRDPESWDAVHDALEKVSREEYRSGPIAMAILVNTFFDETEIADSGLTLQAWDRMLKASVKILQTRNETGAFPKSLPTDLGPARIDPFDGMPLRYRPKGKGFMIYSVGKDREDNGGKRRDPNGPDDQKYDIVMEFK
jgi:hypothetical protein